MEPTRKKVAPEIDEAATFPKSDDSPSVCSDHPLLETTQLELMTLGATSISIAEPQPFLKWAGGKGQLLQQLQPYFPCAIASYSEPFVGGGAVFFHLKGRFPRMQASLWDTNTELVNCYQVVRDDVEMLMERLDEHSHRFKAEHGRYYYSVRGQHQLDEPVSRAARMIFLNKTCFNGLWRVNARGQFNVPLGSYQPDKVSLYERNNLLAVSRALEGVKIAAQDFRETFRAAEAGTFVYVDPPYDPISATANFTSYTKEIFGKTQQTELAALFEASAERGVLLMLSNSDTPFVRKLYENFPLQAVKARRSVNSNAAKRGWISEVLVLSYDVRKLA